MPYLEVERENEVAEHTKGPWHACEKRGSRIQIEHSNNEVGGIGKTLAEVIARFTWAEEAEANALLIAAAPDLLAVCKSFLESFDLLTGPESPFAGNETAIGAIRGAMVMYDLEEPGKIVMTNAVAQRVITRAEGKR